MLMGLGTLKKPVDSGTIKIKKECDLIIIKFCNKV